MVVDVVDHRDRDHDVLEPQGAASNCRKGRPLQRKAEGKPKGLQDEVTEEVADEVSGRSGRRGPRRDCR